MNSRRMTTKVKRSGPHGWIRALLLPLTVLLVLTACGGNEDGETTSPTETQTADAVADFYAGKTVTIIVGFSPGGGYDTYGRLLARKLGDHIPGNPEVIVENMEGANSLVAANHIAKVAPDDGTVLGTFLPSHILGAALGQPEVEFEPLELSWIGTPRPVSVPCVFRNDFHADFASFIESGDTANAAATGRGGNSWYVPMILQAAGLGEWNVVTGYEGSSEARLAVEQGEADAICSTGLVETVPQWVEGPDAFASFVVQTGEERTEGDDLPDVPTWSEFDVPEDIAAIMRVAEGLEQIDRPFAMPPGVPEDRLAAIRQAWTDTWADPDVQAAATEANFVIDARDWQHVQAGVEKIAALPEQLVDQTKEIFGFEF